MDETNFKELNDEKHMASTMQIEHSGCWFHGRFVNFAFLWG